MVGETTLSGSDGPAESYGDCHPGDDVVAAVGTGRKDGCFAMATVTECGIMIKECTCCNPGTVYFEGHCKVCCSTC